MLVDGNMITNLLGIGGKSSKTCPDPLLPVDWTHMPFLKVRSLGLCTITPKYTDSCHYSRDASTTRGKAHISLIRKDRNK